MRTENRERITVFSARQCCALLAEGHARVPAKDRKPVIVFYSVTDS